MISKELLSEGLGIKISKVKGLLAAKDNRSLLSFVSNRDKSRNDGKEIINIHELSNLCKQWAYSVDEYNMESGLDSVYLFDRYSCADDDPVEIFSADTEPEAIFKATQWIYNKRYKDNQHDI